MKIESIEFNKDKMIAVIVSYYYSAMPEEDGPIQTKEFMVKEKDIEDFKRDYTKDYCYERGKENYVRSEVSFHKLKGKMERSNK